MSTLIDEVWNRLMSVNSLAFIANSNANESTGWSGKAEGTVSIDMDNFGRMTYFESGTWTTPSNKIFSFKNTYRWQREIDRIKLEHLRFGPNSPVYLFDLVPSDHHRMISETPHICSEDLYAASLDMDEVDINLMWRVVGPTLNESIAYKYFNANKQSEQTGAGNRLKSVIHL